MNEQIVTEITAVLDHAYRQFGIAATYNSAPVTVRTVSLGHRSEQTPSISFSDVSVRVRVSEVARPYPGDTVAIGETAYLVSAEPTGTPWEWTVDLAEDAS